MTWDKFIVGIIGLCGVVFCWDSMINAPRWQPGAFGLVANGLITLGYLAKPQARI